MKRAKATKKKIPIASAVIALVFCSTVVFGVAFALASRIGAAGNDIGLHIDGTWETIAPTYNNEHITYVFAGDSFSSITESVIINAGPEILADIRDFHITYSGAVVEAEEMGAGSYLLRITADGTFALDGSNILLVSGEGLVRILSFYWESEAVVIDGDRFVRK